MRRIGPILPLLLGLPLLLASPSAPAALADEGRALDEFFKGRIVDLDGKDVTIRYDFRKKEQLEDWKSGRFFRIAAAEEERVDWLDERLELVGSVAVRHVGSWRGNIEVSARLVADAEKDLGAALVPDPESEDFATFTLVERYFHGWDGSEGGTHSIIKFGKQWRERGSTSDFLGFRYIARRPPSVPLTPGRAVPFTFGLRGRELYMKAGDLEIDGKDKGNRFKAMKPAFYTVEGRMLLDDIVIKGSLDKDWLEENGVELRLARPLPPDGLDAETLSLLEAYADGGGAAAPLIRIVADTTRPEPARKAAADALGAGSRAVVPQVLDLLYSPDETTRELGIGVVKDLLGSTYGYRASASDKSRSAAIRKLNDDLRDHPEKLQDDD